jgi:hypothetical protein
MDQWDRDFIDEEVRGYFEFDARDSGSFQFGYVHGQIDYLMWLNAERKFTKPPLVIEPRGANRLHRLSACSR